MEFSCKSDRQGFEFVVGKYVEIIDEVQSEVFNVRILHQDVWRDVKHVTSISETRAGSRAERATRIQSACATSDVDYKLEVNDLDIGTDDNGPLRIELCPDRAYGIVYITQLGIKMINEDALLSQLFVDTFTSETSSSRKVPVLPEKFKTNVVNQTRVSIEKPQIPQVKSSPAVSGKASMNEVDLVPCIRLKEWPNVVRTTVTDIYSFRKPDGSQTPMYVVAAGNKQAPDNDNALQWRLSFSFVEIEISKQLKDHQRRLYGLLKFVFKSLLGEIDLLDSYHLKVLFLWKVETDNLEQWTRKPIEFVVWFLKDVLSTVERKNVPHYFIDECNIFPFHKSEIEEKILNYKRLLLDTDILHNMVTKHVQDVISHDLSIGQDKLDCNRWLPAAEEKLKELSVDNLHATWIAGYQTRLLSVTVYCLQRSQMYDDTKRAVEKLQELLTSYSHDQHVRAVVPLIRIILDKCFSGLRLSVPNVHIKAPVSATHAINLISHAAFSCYAVKDIEGTVSYLKEADSIRGYGKTIGVTVTEFHKGLDGPLDYCLEVVTTRLKSNRFYLPTDVLLLHLRIQCLLKEVPYSGDELHVQKVNNLLTDIVVSASSASVKEPYTGKLSYRQASMLLVHGYGRVLESNSGTGVYHSELCLSSTCDEGIFFSMSKVTNFDLC